MTFARKDGIMPYEYDVRGTCDAYWQFNNLWNPFRLQAGDMYIRELRVDLELEKYQYDHN